MDYVNSLHSSITSPLCRKMSEGSNKCHALPVQGRRFIFDSDSARLEPGSGRQPGCVRFSGTSTCDGVQYDLTMRPEGASAVVQATRTGSSRAGGLGVNGALPAPELGRTPVGSDRRYGTETRSIGDDRQAVRSVSSLGSVAVAGKGVDGYGGTAASSSEGYVVDLARRGDDAVSAELTAFFSGLTIDLQGPEMRYRSMRIAQSFGVATLELTLDVDVYDFPPVNLEF